MEIIKSSLMANVKWIMHLVIMSSRWRWGWLLTVHSESDEMLPLCVKTCTVFAGCLGLLGLNGRLSDLWGGITVRPVMTQTKSIITHF